MAKGDFTMFQEFVDDLANKLHKIKADDVIKLGLVTSALAPTAGSVARWATWAGNDVDDGGGYTAGGLTLTYAVATRWAMAAGKGTFDADDISLPQDPAGFTNGRWGILYNATSINDEAIGYVDLGSDVDETAGPVAINWAGTGIFTVEANV